MNELWAITVALPHEAAEIRQLFKITSRTRYRHFRLEEGKLGSHDALLAITGMGPQRAAESARFLFSQYPVTHLISTGYCGALKGGSTNGDALLAERTAYLEKIEEGYVADLPLLRKIEEALRLADIPVHLGTLLTSSRPILKSEEKEALGLKTGAVGIDMESAAILEAAAESPKKIASVTVRFIVDAMGDELTDTGPFLDENAAVKPLSLVREMLRRPKLFQELPDLGRKAARARVSLTRFLGRMFGVGESQTK